jgi:hypothetical protein
MSTVILMDTLNLSIGYIKRSILTNISFAKRIPYRIKFSGVTLFFK